MTLIEYPGLYKTNFYFLYKKYQVLKEMSLVSRTQGPNPYFFSVPHENILNEFESEKTNSILKTMSILGTAYITLNPTHL